jgi:hypothetical protein
LAHDVGCFVAEAAALYSFAGGGIGGRASTVSALIVGVADGFQAPCVRSIQFAEALTNVSVRL